MTYDLRRLRSRGFIHRSGGTRQYRLTPEGRRLAIFLTKVYARILTPSLARIDPTLRPTIDVGTPLALAWRKLDSAMDDFIRDSAVAA